MGMPFLCAAGQGRAVLVGMGEDGRLARGVVVRRLLAVDQGPGSVSSLHVRVMAVAAGVTVRTVWKWLAEPREGRLEPVVRPTPQRQCLRRAGTSAGGRGPRGRPGRPPAVGYSRGPTHALVLQRCLP